MTDEEMFALAQQPQWTRVAVAATDYRYEGWIVAVFDKRSGKSRCVIEDDSGRLFIHNASQLTEAS